MVLGVDPALRHTGVGLVRGTATAQELVHHEVLTASAKTPGGECLRRIGARVTEILEIHKPDALAIEKVFAGKDPLSAFSVGLVRGVVLYVAACCGVEVAEYPSTTVKLAVAGYGLATKEQVQYMVGQILRCPHTELDHDEADALAMAICHLQSHRFEARRR